MFKAMMLEQPQVSVVNCPVCPFPLLPTTLQPPVQHTRGRGAVCRGHSRQSQAEGEGVWGGEWGMREGGRVREEGAGQEGGRKGLPPWPSCPPPACSSCLTWGSLLHGTPTACACALPKTVLHSTCTLVQGTNCFGMPLVSKEWGCNGKKQVKSQVCIACDTKPCGTALQPPL